VDAETLGGARMHTSVSGVAHYMARDDRDCLSLIRQKVREQPEPKALQPEGVNARDRIRQSGLYDLMPADHRLPYDMEEVVRAIRRRRDDYLEFQPDYAPEMLCANCRPARPGDWA
jgi:3-methylcrotonyl-CoA carboxylase beta subunit